MGAILAGLTSCFRWRTKGDTTGYRAVREEDAKYYGPEQLLEKPIPQINTNRRELVDQRCKRCKKGPLWLNKTFCCRKCENGCGHEVMCSLNYKLGSYLSDPTESVTVPVWFLRQIARCKGCA